MAVVAHHRTVRMVRVCECRRVGVCGVPWRRGGLGVHAALSGAGQLGKMYTSCPVNGLKPPTPRRTTPPLSYGSNVHSSEPSEQITVVGVGADGWPGLSEHARAAIEHCDVLFGSPRQLELIPQGTAKRVPWPSPLLPALDGLLAEHAGRQICVLASGDPLLSGIGTTLIRRLGAQRVHIVPTVSSVTFARARMGWSFEETEVITTVGRDVHRVARALAPGRRLLVLTSGPSTPAEVAALLTAQGYGASALTVLENLGDTSEHRREGTAERWAPADCAALNIIAIDCTPSAGTKPLPTIAGLPDDAYEHDGQLTKRDLRAAALARLAPMPGELLWDVGAGAGSIAIEWSRAHPANRAVAFERDGQRADRIERNAAQLGVPELRVVVGEVPDSLPSNENPHAIFIGGGVSAPGVLDACLAALSPGGRLVAHGVTLQAEQALAGAYTAHGGELTRITVEHAEPLGGFTGWRPARTVTQWSYREERA